MIKKLEDLLKEAQEHITKPKLDVPVVEDYNPIEEEPVDLFEDGPAKYVEDAPIDADDSEEEITDG